jgi:hypothetical protein
VGVARFEAGAAGVYTAFARKTLKMTKMNRDAGPWQNEEPLN